jgi:hypothetical protein
MIPSARLRLTLACICIFTFCLLLAGCYHITLKETRVDGLQSSIKIKLPGNLQKLDFPVPLDPLTQRYFLGQHLYGELDSGLQIAIYTNSVDRNKMYEDLHIDNNDGDEYRNSLYELIESASSTVLNKIDAENVSIEQGSTTISGQHALTQTYTFRVKDKKMEGRLIGFHSGPATWIIIVAYDASKQDKVDLANQVLQSVAITQ